MKYEKEIGLYLANMLLEMVAVYEDGVTGFALDHVKSMEAFGKASPLYQKKALKAYQDSFDKHEHEGQNSAHEHGMNAARETFARAKKNARANQNRKNRDDLMGSLGLTKVKGAVSGKTYWESEDLGESKYYHDPKWLESKGHKERVRDGYSYVGSTKIKNGIKHVYSLPSDHETPGDHRFVKKGTWHTTIHENEIREDEKPITQSHIDASYAKVLAAHRAHAKAANAGYGERTTTPGSMEKKDARIRELQNKHQAAAVAHKALVKRFEAQK